MCEADLYIAVAYTLLCKLNYDYITKHFFINIFQMEHFSAAEIYHGLWEKYELSCDTKISKSLKKVEKIGMGSFNKCLTNL